jgi:GrpB-like predicted nucleotidyltransferase (UPF0157 family)/predicted kinase
MIVIINGPCGIGKTSVSWALVGHFDRAVMLDGDYIGAVHPFEIYDEARVEHLYQTLRHLLAFHSEHGEYHNFVINYVFETPASLARLRNLLSDLDDEIYAFRLTADAAAIAQRIQGREDEEAELNWYLSRYQELVAIQERAAAQGDMGFIVDTTGLNAGEVADVIWRNLHEAVVLVPYDPAWPAQYAAERARVAAALGDLAPEIHHIGSTAVPGLVAKPVIDLMVAVRHLDDAADCIAPLQALGYAFIDHPENIDRRFFRKGLPRTHHLHIVEAGSATLADHLDFRDALRADPALREAYAALKTELAARHKHERATYTDSKTAFVREVLARWRANR